MIYLGKPLIDAGFYASHRGPGDLFRDELPPGNSVEKLFLDVVKAMSSGGLDIVRLVPILVSMSVLVNLIGLAGLAPKLSALIFDVGTQNIYISLLIASILPLLLGTACPWSRPISFRSRSSPRCCRSWGWTMVAAHLFFIYWGVLGAVTPPTCEAAVVSAGIAKGDWLKTGFYACGLGAVAFCLPYFMVLDPALVGTGRRDRGHLRRRDGIHRRDRRCPMGLFGWKDSPLTCPCALLFLIGGAMLLFPEAW